MQRSLVLDRNKKPLMSCHPARARELLKKGKAAVFKLYPFTIILKNRENGCTQEVELKIDPGSKTTGLALVANCKRGKKVIWAGNLEHRGMRIKLGLNSRRLVRHGRRYRKNRYRKPRFLNRTRSEGWLPPSLMHRVYTLQTWVERLMNICPIKVIIIETVRFDTQKMETPEISGIEYQQGTLFGYEVREYLLEKWNRKCVYCGKTGVPLEVEHIIPKSRGGSDRVSNLTLACKICNRKKGTRTAGEFGFSGIQKRAKQSLRDVAAVNATRYIIGDILKEYGLPITFWSGGRTKHNRIKQKYKKDHWIDAVCVGKSGEQVFIPTNQYYLKIKAMGHGSRQMCCVNKFGFPRTGPKTVKIVHGFRTGDIAKAVVTKGKKLGTYIGRVVIRKSGSFSIKNRNKLIQSISWKYFKRLHMADGYLYN